MPEKKRIPFKKRREIAHRAKVESGMKGKEASQGTATGRKLRKVFTKSKTGVKKVGAGSHLGTKKTTKPDKPKFKKVDVQAKRFESRKGETGRSKTYSVETKEGMTKASERAQKEAGVTKKVAIKKDAGAPTYKENIAKAEASKKVADKAKYKKHSRTEQQKEKTESLRKARSASIRAAGGNVRKGERRLKKVLKKRMKKDYREGTYDKY